MRRIDDGEEVGGCEPELITGDVVEASGEVVEEIPVVDAIGDEVGGYEPELLTGSDRVDNKGDDVGGFEPEATIGDVVDNKEDEVIEEEFVP